MGSKTGDKSVDKKKHKSSDKSRDKSTSSVKSKSSDKSKKKDKPSKSKSPSAKDKDKSPKSPTKTDRSKAEGRTSRKQSVQSSQANPVEIKIQSQEKNCVHHNHELTFFCESCEEPICRDCTILGPHNNQLHRINRVEEAFRSRVSRLNETIKNNLLAKRDQLLAQIHRVEYRIEEIRYVKQVIERDARSDYGGILERLNSAEGMKVAVLQHSMSELQKDLDKINDVGHNFNEFTKDPNEPVGFLLRSRNLYEQIEQLVAKPFNVNINVTPYDLPRELTDVRMQLEKVNSQKKLIDFKTEVIWKLTEEKKVQEQQIKQQMDNKAFEELNQWAELTGNLNNELQKFQLVCFYCGVNLDEDSVNKKCSQNTQSIDQDFQGHCSKIPDSKYHGNHRHFFGPPNKDLIEQVQQSKSKTKLYNMLEVQMGKIKKIAQENNLDLLKEFQQVGSQETQTVNLIGFRFILNHKLELEVDEIDQLTKVFDKDNKKVINYSQFMQFINDPTTVHRLDEILNFE